MAISTLHSTIFRPLLLLGVISLVACGGGGGGKKSKDTTPEAFSFAASTNATTSAVVTSPAVTISGIDAPATVSITGGEYSINGGAFTAGSGKVSSGQTIAVKVTASSVTNTPVDAVLSVGGIRATFRVTTAPDVTPGNFSFTPATNAALSTAFTSSTVTLSGFDVAVPVSITNGEYSINGGAFTSAVGTISPAQTIAVKVVSSNANSTAVDATLTVGGVSATYSVTTLADATPNAFTFTPTTNAALGSTNTSNTVTVEGIEVAAPVAVTGGEYSINGGAFTAAAGTVTNGQTIAVKATAPAGTELTQSAVVTIGGVSGTYSVTTIPDTTAPVAEFKFPTPYTMSEATSVKVRGTATDEHAITSVKVVVNGTTEIAATPKAAGDFSSWTADVPLMANAENEIKVVATDDRNNSIAVDTANTVVIRQADGLSAFPDEAHQFGDASAGIVVDQQNGRNRLLVADSTEYKIFSVSIDTGERLVYKDLNQEGIGIIWGMVIDDSVNEPVLYAQELSQGNILKMNVADGTVINSYHSDLYGEPRVLLLDEKDGIKKLVTVNEGEFGNNSDVISFDLQTELFSTISSDVVYSLMPSPWGLALDKTRDRYLVTVRNRNSNLYGIYAVNRTTGERQAFSTNEVGTGETFIDRTSLREISIDEEGNVLYVLDNLTGKLFAIDLQTGNRRVVVDLSYKDANGDALRIRLMNIHTVLSEQYAFISDYERKSLLVVDLTSGEKVILSKSKNN